jgi:hypothetical protein
MPRCAASYSANLKGGQMTTHTDLGVDEATFAAALRVIGHPWRPGQRCGGTPTRNSLSERWRCSDCSYKYNPFYTGSHDIPIPAVTDELLMQMLRLIGIRDYEHKFYRIWTARADENYALEVAIIGATAALKTPAAPTSERPK